ncbi:hypothetical protein R1sor_019354 [Riccia sorocarpa]|uniref:Uncharacterized protein n=1 Tax=Riccia sorocarpa TaxID=122646 RepID=A0ABD3IF03_9MARC
MAPATRGTWKAKAIHTVESADEPAGKVSRHRKNFLQYEYFRFVKVEFPSWWYMRIWPHPNDASFIEKERRESVKVYLCKLNL